MYLQLLKDTYRTHSTLHHAYLIQGNKDVVIPAITAFIESDLKMKTRGNPDVLFFEFDSFGVADGKALKGMASQKALQERQIFIATFNTMTHEAQNALLKLLEDPSTHTHFFLITSNIGKLLATLRSRMFILEEERTVESNMIKRARTFLKQTKKERLFSLRDVIESKDKELAHSFFSALEEVCYAAIKKGKRDEIIDGLSLLEETKQFLFDRGASLKLLLEHTALVLPKVQ